MTFNSFWVLHLFYCTFYFFKIVLCVELVNLSHNDDNNNNNNSNNNNNNDNNNNNNNNNNILILIISFC